MTRVLLSAVLLVSRCGRARADQAAPPLRTLLTQPAQLAAWLAARDPRIEAPRAKLEAAQASARQARVLPNPQLHLRVSDFVIGQTNAASGGTGSSNPALSLGQTLIFTAGIDRQRGAMSCGSQRWIG
jgi:outer membrane murein-binding lipoprotein Lpp